MKISLKTFLICCLVLLIGFLISCGPGNSNKPYNAPYYGIDNNEAIYMYGETQTITGNLPVTFYGEILVTDSEAKPVNNIILDLHVVITEIGSENLSVSKPTLLTGSTVTTDQHGRASYELFFPGCFFGTVKVVARAGGNYGEATYVSARGTDPTDIKIGVAPNAVNVASLPYNTPGVGVTVTVTPIAGWPFTVISTEGETATGTTVGTVGFVNIPIGVLTTLNDGDTVTITASAISQYFGSCDIQAFVSKSETVDIEAAAAQCGDGLDNDGDTLIDFNADPNGADAQPGVAGVDDDGDTYIDNAYNVGPDLQPGVATVDDDGINGVDDAGELGFGGSDDVLSNAEQGTPGSDDPDPGCISAVDATE